MPNYRIRIEIYDEETGETLAREDQPLMSNDEDNVANAYRALKHFKESKESHEETHYA